MAGVLFSTVWHCGVSIRNSNQKELPKQKEKQNMKPGLYANIHKKKARIKAGSKEKMRKPGSKGAPTDAAFARSKLSAKEVGYGR